MPDPEWLELKINTSNSDEGGANAGEGEEGATNALKVSKKVAESGRGHRFKQKYWRAKK